MFGWKSATADVKRDTVARPTGHTAVLSGHTHGLGLGIRVASNLGWTAVEDLAVGDKVLTFDHGMQTIVDLERTVVWSDGVDTPPEHWPVIIPKGALFNREELILPEHQGLLVEDDSVDVSRGDPFALVSAGDLVGVRGIHRAAPEDEIELIVIGFEAQQVIYVDGGTLIQTPAMTPRFEFLDTRAASATSDVQPKASVMSSAGRGRQLNI